MHTVPHHKPVRDAASFHQQVQGTVARNQKIIIAAIEPVAYRAELFGLGGFSYFQDGIPVIVLCQAVGLPPLGFSLVTLAVCMLAAWEWGQLAGFANRHQRIWGAVICGLVLAAMLLGMPEFNRSVHLPLIAGSLWAAAGWWLLALFLVFFYPRSAGW